MNITSAAKSRDNVSALVKSTQPDVNQDANCGDEQCDARSHRRRTRQGEAGATKPMSATERDETAAMNDAPEAVSEQRAGQDDGRDRVGDPRPQLFAIRHSGAGQSGLRHEVDYRQLPETVELQSRLRIGNPLAEFREHHVAGLADCPHVLHKFIFNADFKLSSMCITKSTISMLS